VVFKTTAIDHSAISPARNYTGRSSAGRTTTAVTGLVRQ
jgi:hypothetical protein